MIGRAADAERLDARRCGAGARCRRRSPSGPRPSRTRRRGRRPARAVVAAERRRPAARPAAAGRRATSPAASSRCAGARGGAPSRAAPGRPARVEHVQRARAHLVQVRARPPARRAARSRRAPRAASRTRRRPRPGRRAAAARRRSGARATGPRRRRCAPRSQTSGLISGSTWRSRSAASRCATSASVRSRTVVRLSASAVADTALSIREPSRRLVKRYVLTGSCRAGSRSPRGLDGAARTIRSWRASASTACAGPSACRACSRPPTATSARRSTTRSGWSPRTRSGSRRSSSCWPAACSRSRPRRTPRARRCSRRRAARSSFARHAFNELASFFAGWALTLDYIITIAISAFFVPHYLAAFWPALKHPPGDVIGGIVVIVLLARLNIRGLGESAKLNLVLAVARPRHAGPARRSSASSWCSTPRCSSTRSTWAARRPGRS